MFQKKPFSASILFLAVSLLVPSDPVYANPNRCEAVFAKAPSSTRALKPSEVRILGLIDQQRKVLAQMSDALDPITMREYNRFLNRYASYINDPSRPELTRNSEATLQRQLESMTTVSQEIQGITYPRAELAEKLDERRKVMSDLTTSERAWLQYSLLQNEQANALAAKKAGQHDGKSVANANRKLQRVAQELPKVRRLLAEQLQSSTIHEGEKQLLLAFLSDRSLEEITSLVLKDASAVHISHATRQDLMTAASKDAAFAIFVAHLRERHHSRLQVEIDVTLSTYTQVAFKYYARVFSGSGFTIFSPHAMILDIDLRERLVNLERQLRAAENNLVKNRTELRNLWNTRATLLGRIQALENYIETSPGTMGSNGARADIVVGLSGLFRDLQTVEDSIGSYLPTLSVSERNALLRQEDLTLDRLMNAFETNITTLRQNLTQLRLEGRNWLGSRVSNDDGGDIDLF